MGVDERRERERESRRDTIVAAAQKIFFEKGIEHTRMRDIAAEAELSKATLYLYFTDKEELTFEILYLTLLKVEELIESAAEGKARGYEKLKAIHFYEDIRISDVINQAVERAVNELEDRKGESYSIPEPLKIDE